MSFYEHLPGAPGLIEHWLEGYRTVRAVSKAEEEEIPTFVMLRRLLLVAWVGSHVETDLARSPSSPGLCRLYQRIRTVEYELCSVLKSVQAFRAAKA